jgi:hypothetical protein
MTATTTTAAPTATTAAPDDPVAIFDEVFYLNRYPGIAEAVRRGDFSSGLHHYTLFGASEGRVTSPATDDARRDLMLGFCSLGRDCEFGIAQRMFGAEPIDLLRWAGTPSDVLIRLLRARFEGIGDSGEIDVYVSPSGEYHIRHKRYLFAWHSWSNLGETTPEKLLAREVKRLPYLSNKLVDDMADGARIFVVKHRDMTSEVVEEILASMHVYGRSTLMYVTEGKLGVTREGDHLLHGMIPKFADETNVTETVVADDWLEVCQQARAR